MTTTPRPPFDLYFEPANPCGHAVRVQLYEWTRTKQGDERRYRGALVLSVPAFKALFAALHNAGILGAADGDFGVPADRSGQRESSGDA